MPALALLALSCSAADSVHIPLESIDADLVFVVKRSESNPQLSIVNEFARAPKDFEASPLARFEITPQEIAYVIGFKTSALKNLEPAFDAKRTSEVQLRKKGIGTEIAKDLRTRPLPATFQVLSYAAKTQSLETASVDHTQFLAQNLELVVPIDLDTCRNQEQETLVNYPKSRETGCKLSFNKLFGVDESRFVVSSGVGVHLVQRGQPFDCEAATSTLAQRHFLPFGGELNHFALGSAPLEDGSFIAVVVRSYKDNDDPTAYVISEYRLDTLGFSALTSSTSYRPQDFPNLTEARRIYVADVAVDSNNQVLVVFSKGSIAIRKHPQKQYQLIKLTGFYVDPRNKDLVHINTRDHPDAPHLVTSEGFAFLGDAQEDDWEKLSMEHLEIALTVVDTAFGTKADEIYFAANDGAQGWLLHQEKAGISEFDFAYSDRLAGCFFNGRLRELRAIAIDEDAVYALPQCNAILRIRHRDRCATYLNYEENPQYSFEAGPLRDLLLFEQQIIVVGDDGLMLHGDLKDFDRAP